MSVANPEYPDLGVTVAKFRAMATRAGGLSKLPRDTRRKYGNAVHAAFFRRTRSIARLVEPGHAHPCASGTALTGDNRGEIGRAVAAQHRRALLACPEQIRRARTPNQWQEMYDMAMAEKRARESKAKAAALLAVTLDARNQKRRAKCERVLERFQNPKLPPGDDPGLYAGFNAPHGTPTSEIEW